MALATKTPKTTAAETKVVAEATDLSAAFGPGAPGVVKAGGREYTRKVALLVTPEQYAAIEEEVRKRGYARHGGPSRLIREVLAGTLGFQP